MLAKEYNVDKLLYFLRREIYYILSAIIIFMTRFDTFI